MHIIILVHLLAQHMFRGSLLYRRAHIFKLASNNRHFYVQDGHIKECSAISFHPDGSLVTTADYAGVVLVWDLRSGQQVQSLQGHVKKITSVCMSANGFQVVSGRLLYPVNLHRINSIALNLN